MSMTDQPIGEADFDPSDHQTSYVFTPVTNHATAPLRSRKRRRISKQQAAPQDLSVRSQIQFPPLFNGTESSTCANIRQRLFESYWASTESKIQSILRNANNNTLCEVASFVDGASSAKTQIPTGLIVTGPNIASQELLFSQLTERLRSHAQGPVVVLRSGDAANLKTILKKLIRDVTNQKEEEDDDAQTAQQDGRKLINYDLQIVHDHLKSSNSSRIVVAFQDSEAFDSGLLSEVLVLFSSWLDRIPFVVLFGIATSVELFHERLPRGATRCLHGAQFDVEQTSKTLEKVFEKVVAGCDAPLFLGPGFVTTLLERQHDHVQSLQTFVSALKYAYMSHFYANPLSILLSDLDDLDVVLKGLQPEHVEAVRMLPSFRRRIETLLDEHMIDRVRHLLNFDKAVLDEIRLTLEIRKDSFISLRQTMHILATVVSGDAGSIDRMGVYVKALSGQLEGSQIVEEFLKSIKTLTTTEVLSLTKAIMKAVTFGDPGSDLEGWSESAEEFLEDLSRVQNAVQVIVTDAEAAGVSIRSKYTLQNKILRTTVVAQKVQLSKEKSALTELDLSYTKLLDKLGDTLKEYFKFENPQDQFLHEVWLYDLKSPNREVFTPKPRHAIERALSSPHDYLGCTCCKGSEEGLSSSQPPTAILYQLYLETGGLINVFDLWSAFFTIVGGDDGEDCDERRALMLFYRALADLKLLGMVKQSRKKTDHLAKLAWKGV